MPSRVLTGLLYPELSYTIMAIAFDVHNTLGPGFTENIYEQAMVCEFQARSIAYEQQKVINVFYKGKPIGIYRLDLVIEDQIILELKAVDQITDLHRTQLRSYLKATGLQLGIVLNFSNTRVEHDRVAYSIRAAQAGKKAA